MIMGKTIEEQYEKHKNLVDSYFVNDAKKLKVVVDRILFKLKFNVDPVDFYSLADVIFCDVLLRYDGEQDFEGFLYSCLRNKFKTEMTRRNCKKRRNDIDAISIYECIGEETNITIEDTIKANQTVESEIFQKKEDCFSAEMEEYLVGLSNIQREILHYISIGFKVDEILKELHIDLKEYDNNITSIYSYENIKKIRKVEE